MDLSKLKEKIQASNFIFIGEIHGIKENLTITKNFLNFFKREKIPVILALEWPKELTVEINNFLQKKKNKLDWQNWRFSKSPDGRISKEHLDFLKWLRGKGIMLICFDEGGLMWNQRDKKMAQNIFNFYKRNKSKKILAIMGNLHAKKKDFKFENKIYKPLSLYFSNKKLLTIKLEYLSGSYFNIKSKRIIPKNKTKDVLKLFKFNIKKSKSPFFDYMIFIKKAHSVKILI